MKRLLILIPVLMLLANMSSVAHAQNLLANGDLEVGTTEFLGWSAQEFRTGAPEAVDAISRVNFANRQGEVANQFGAWLKPWATGDTSTVPSNAILSQTVAGAAGQEYTFRGWSHFQENYAGGVDFLHFTSPLDPGQTGTVPSPTDTFFELAFLNSSNNVIGTANALDLRAARQPFPNDITWHEHILSGTAPAGTTSVRVSASMIDGVFNRNPSQSAFVDDFSLTNNAQPALELLTNGTLNETPPELPASFTLTETPEPRDTAGGASFANNTAGGANGLWLKPFSGSLAAPSDAVLSQTISATPNGNYTFSAASKWEANYSGGLAVVSGQPSPTKTLLEIAFLDASRLVIGTPVVTNLKTAGQLNDSTWRTFSVNGTAPANAASVRVSAIMDDGVASGANPQSAFFDDLVLTLTTTPGNDADFDNDGDVDGQDFLVWQRNVGTTSGATNANGDADANGSVNGADLTVWRSSFGSAASATVGAVPEPATGVIAIVGLGLATVFGRRSRRS